MLGALYTQGCGQDPLETEQKGGKDLASSGTRFPRILVEKRRFRGAGLHARIAERRYERTALTNWAMS